MRDIVADLMCHHQARPWLKGEFNLGYAYSNTNRNGQSSNSGSNFLVCR